MDQIIIHKNKALQISVEIYNTASEAHSVSDYSKISAYTFIYQRNAVFESSLGQNFVKNAEASLDYSLENEANLVDFVTANHNTYYVLCGNENLIMHFANIISKLKSKISYIYIPYGLPAQINSPFCICNGREFFPQKIIVITECAKEKPSVFLDSFAFVMELAIKEDAPFYEWLIENLYEICDQEDKTISEMITRCLLIQKNCIEKKTIKERLLSRFFAQNLANSFIQSKAETAKGQALVLGILIKAYVSWKMEFLSMEEYYEIRDMFVPFGLSISYSKITPNAIMNEITQTDEISLDNAETVLLKKIGKLVSVQTLPKELYLEALKEHFYTEDNLE